MDCPGQVELYTHVPIMRTILDRMQNQWGFSPGCMVSVFCVDATFCCDAQKMLSGQLLALSSMIALELPHINVLTKGDLLPERDIEAILNLESATQLWEMEQDRTSLFALPRNMESVMIMEDDLVDGVYKDMDGNEEEEEEQQQSSSTEQEEKESNNDTNNENNAQELQQQKEELQQQAEEVFRRRKLEARRRQRHRLTDNIAGLLDDYTMVGFVPLNINDEESIDHVLITVDHAIQYGEDLEVRGAEGYDDMVNPNDDDYGGGGDD